MSDEVTNTFTMTMAGRVIEFKHPNLGQVLVLQRRYHRALREDQALDDTDEAKGKALMDEVIKSLDFIDKLFVSDEDRQFVEDQMLAGTIDWTQVVKALSGGDKSQPPDDEAPKPVKRAPKKSPKAAPQAGTAVAAARQPVAKKTASGRAAKR